MEVNWYVLMEQIKKIIVYAVDQAVQELEAFIRCSSLA